MSDSRHVSTYELIRKLQVPDPNRFEQSLTIQVFNGVVEAALDAVQGPPDNLKVQDVKPKGGILNWFGLGS
jgi:phospholipase/lecithinase/hemolysin